MRKFLSAAAAAAIVAMSVATSAQAAPCWTAEPASAARIRDLQTYLMVETLRCQVMGYNLTPEYNAFVAANRTAIAGANSQLKAFFIRAEGPVYGQSAYDRFTTSLANAYGSARTNADSCFMARSVAQEGAAMANSHEGLLMIADRQALSPRLPGGRCGQETLVQAVR